MKLIDKLKELFKPKCKPEMPEEQEQIVEQEQVVEQEQEVEEEIEPETNLTPNEKMISTEEYDKYEIHLWGNEDGLQELSDLIEGLENEQELAQVSLIMRAIGVKHDNDDDDVWWSTCGVMDGDGFFSLIIYEYIKCRFNEERLGRVIRKLKNANGIDPGIGWELRRFRTTSSQN